MGPHPPCDRPELPACSGFRGKILTVQCVSLPRLATLLTIKTSVCPGWNFVKWVLECWRTCAPLLPVGGDEEEDGGQHASGCGGGGCAPLLPVGGDEEEDGGQHASGCGGGPAPRCCLWVGRQHGERPNGKCTRACAAPETRVQRCMKCVQPSAWQPST